MRVIIRRLWLIVIFALMPSSIQSARFNAWGLEFFTCETPHFRITYHSGLQHLVPRVADQCEKLYQIYRNKFCITLPDKTDIVVIDGDVSNGWALANTNTITIWTHDFDFNLRGSHDWFEDVITHEYAHIVSIQAGLKLPPAIPDLRAGFFSHPNERKRMEAFHSFPADILPHWFTEGIAQYASSEHGSDSWDTHRDMILRTLTLSGKLISWAHMQVFSGKGDDYEKTYNQGFSMVKYIAEKYGEDKITALLRESQKIARVDFDNSIKAVLGISAKTLYEDWKQYLYKKYKKQLDDIGPQIYGRKINIHGYENFWPRFSADGKKVYFLSNGKNDYGFKSLYIADLCDTIPPDKRIKPIGAVPSVYDLHFASGKICFVSSHSRKSTLPPAAGGAVTSDLFIDTIPPEKSSFRLFFRKTDKQLTEKQSIFGAAFSPDGNKLAFAKRSVDRFYLGIVDTSGKNYRLIYPPKDSPNLKIEFIYSIDWSPDGKLIAFSFFDRHNRKIALFDTAANSCNVLCDTEHDERDPAFSPDGKYIYFSSDRTGIFNIYRYEFSTGKLRRVTNVAGGAFAPSVSPDGTRLVYAGYAAEGYGIYLIDSIKCVEDSLTSGNIVSRKAVPEPSYNTAVGQERPYSYIPRQFLLVPAIINEQAVSRNDNVNEGVSAFKAGAIFNILDPLTLSNFGNELNGYFFLEPKRILSFINLDQKGINVEANYDLGLYGVTRMLPLTLSGEFMLRGIAGEDSFFNETEAEMQNLPYRVDLQNLTLQISHFIDGDYELGGIPKRQLAVHLLAGSDKYNVNLLLRAFNLPVFTYCLSKGYRIGSMGTFSSVIIEPTSYIAPRGIIARLQYDLRKLYSLKDENSFDSSGQERTDAYLYHQLMGHAKLGVRSPWSERQSLHVNLQSTIIDIIRQDTTFPSYQLPGAWVPGYSYYYRTKRTVEKNNGTAEQLFDTLLVTGKAVVNGELSYRFPLSRKFMDKKIGVFYLERIYGAANLNFGGGWDKPSDFLKFTRDDWLFAYGLELRIEAISFSSYPFALKLRWDYGADRPSPLGGHHFTLAIGYDFDNWGTVLLPDYSSFSVKGL